MRQSQIDEHPAVAKFFEQASKGALARATPMVQMCIRDRACAATTRGVGELIADAVSRGAETVYVGLGGSATVDGGVGMLQALGARVLDASGGQVVHGLYGCLLYTSRCV